MIKLKDILIEDCWKGYKQIGMKKKGKKIVPNCVPIEEELINEIGEGVTPLPWHRTGVTKVDSWVAELSSVDKADTKPNWTALPALLYEFKSDKATYEARIAGGWMRHTFINFSRKPISPKPQDFNLVAVVSFDLKNKANSNDEPELTNYGEQFKVLSTVTDIVDKFVKEISEWKWVKLEEIRIMPKLEDDEEGKPITQSKRGRLYLAYIKKQGAKLPGTWTAEITNDMFVLRSGKITSSTHPDRYISI